MGANLLLVVLALVAAPVPPDAVILEERLGFRLEGDGSTVRREYRLVKLNDRRAISAFADPRIPYRDGIDTLTILQARTHLPDGTILPVPEYSLNTATPGDIAGWPRYAEWRERIVSFSGIEAGVLLELEFELRSPPTSSPRLSRDLKLSADYPIRRKVVTVYVPDGVQLRHRIDGAEAATETTSAGTRSWRWSLQGLPATRGEPGSRLWQHRCPRLRFTLATSADEWVRGYLALVRAAAEPDAAITAFAKAAAGQEEDPRKRCDRVCSAISSTFNLVKSGKALDPPRCLPAAEVFRANYGNRLEAAALLIACLRSLGMDPVPALAVDSRTWDEEVPVDSGLHGVLVQVPSLVTLDPMTGPVRHPEFPLTKLYEDRPGGKIVRDTYGPRGGHAFPIDLSIEGRLDLHRDGTLTGELHLGSFDVVTEKDLSGDQKAQSAFAAAMLDRCLPGLKLESVAVDYLIEDRIQLKVKVKSKTALPSVGGTRVLRLAPGPMILSHLKLPLDTAGRTTAVGELRGGFMESIDLDIRFPPGFRVLAAPLGHPGRVVGKSQVRQEITRGEGRISLERFIRLEAATVSAQDFEAFRRQVNLLRSDAGRTFIFEQK